MSAATVAGTCHCLFGFYPFWQLFHRVKIAVTLVGDKAFKMISHLLFETASGYGIFEAKLHEDIGSRSQAVQDSIKDLAKFGKMVSLISFSPFKNAAEALQNANDISEGQQGAISCWGSN